MDLDSAAEGPPTFGTSDILNFDHAQTALHEKDLNEMDIDAEFATMESNMPRKSGAAAEEEHPSFRDRPRIDSPPSGDEYEEEPEGWEEEMSIGEVRVVTQRLEGQSGTIKQQTLSSSTSAARTETTTVGSVMTAGGSGGRIELSFGASDIFDTAAASCESKRPPYRGPAADHTSASVPSCPQAHEQPLIRIARV